MMMLMKAKICRVQCRGAACVHAPKESSNVAAAAVVVAVDSAVGVGDGAAGTDESASPRRSSRDDQSVARPTRTPSRQTQRRPMTKMQYWTRMRKMNRKDDTGTSKERFVIVRPPPSQTASRNAEPRKMVARMMKRPKALKGT